MKVVVEDDNGTEIFRWEGYAENISEALTFAHTKRQEDYAKEYPAERSD